MLKGPARKAFQPAADKGSPSSRVVTAKRPNHVWHVDLTALPIGSGFWVTWSPFAMPQRWPFCWWVLAVVDHFSRRALALRLFKQQPGARQVCAVMSHVFREVGQAPRYTVTDKGSQFRCPWLKRYCKGRGIRPRFGAVGKRGSIAVVERFIRSFKVECVRRLPLVPMGFDEIRAEMDWYARWFDGHRPHEALEGRTPDEVYHRRAPAHARPRSEPRARWPRGSPCAAPQARVRGPSGARIRLDLGFVANRPHLPIVRLSRTA
jgi:putative transposase